LNKESHPAANFIFTLVFTLKNGFIFNALFDLYSKYFRIIKTLFALNKHLFYIQRD